tara:strand:+ start:1599 stop:2240 length:642 start_codon:yes stop_codon:yes gene_type:complete
MTKIEISVAKILVQETRVFHYRYPQWKTLKSKLLPEIKKHQEEDPVGLPASNKLCWRGMKSYTCEEEILQPINRITTAWLAHYFPDEQFHAHITYWININKPGSTNMIHNHVMALCHLSGVYYVQGVNTGGIRFYTHEQLYNLIPDGMPYVSKIGHAPSDGDILLFPSYLQHDVDVNLTRKERITIGFNVNLKKKENSNVIPFKKGSGDETKH